MCSWRLRASRIGRAASAAALRRRGRIGTRRPGRMARASVRPSDLPDLRRTLAGRLQHHRSHRPYAARPVLHERPAAMPGDSQRASGSAPAARAGPPARQPTPGAGGGQCARAGQRGARLCTGEGSRGPAGPRDTVSRRPAGAAWQRRRRAPAVPPASPLPASCAPLATNWMGSIAARQHQQLRGMAAAPCSVVQAEATVTESTARSHQRRR